MPNRRSPLQSHVSTPPHPRPSQVSPRAYPPQAHVLPESSPPHALASAPSYDAPAQHPASAVPPLLQRLRQQGVGFLQHSSLLNQRRHLATKHLGQPLLDVRRGHRRHTWIMGNWSIHDYDHCSKTRVACSPSARTSCTDVSVAHATAVAVRND